MRCSPDNARRRRRLCAKWETSAGGTGTDRFPVRQLPPSTVRRWKVPEPVPGHAARGVPRLKDRREMGWPGIGSGSVGAAWLPSASPSRERTGCARGPCWAWHPLARRGTGDPR